MMVSVREQADHLLVFMRLRAYQDLIYYHSSMHHTVAQHLSTKQQQAKHRYQYAYSLHGLSIRQTLNVEPVWLHDSSLLPSHSSHVRHSLKRDNADLRAVGRCFGQGPVPVAGALTDG